MARYGAIRTVAGLVALAASAAAWPSAGGEGLAGSAHDFTASSAASGGSALADGAHGGSLCTYCHTPQAGSGARLLWNHRLSKNEFRWDASSTSAGTPLPGFSGTTYKGASAKCLSCHDGSVAVGDIGPDSVGPAGAAPVAAGPITNANSVIGAAGNLSGNHPIAVPYPMGRLPNTYNGVTNGGGRMLFAANEWQSNPLESAAAHVRLYRDDGAGNIDTLPAGALTTNAGIECSSCHDPHNRAAVDVMFLRGKRAGRSQADGYLCLQCHNL